MSARKLFLWGMTAVVVVLLLLSMAAQLSGAARADDSFPGVQPPSASLAQAPKPTAHPLGGMSPTERLAAPQMSDPPTQIELGHHQYWMSCMVCHGDRGQGLTVEWRSVLDPEDMNCWQAKCHGASHPPYGFRIPLTSPLVMGTGALSRYKTAAELFEYVSTTMPWPYPGLFEDQEYWELTAYLASANKVDLGQEPLGPDTADEILLLPGIVQTHHSTVGLERVIAGVTAGLLLGAAILYRSTRAPEHTVATSGES